MALFIESKTKKLENTELVFLREEGKHNNKSKKNNIEYELFNVNFFVCTISPKTKTVTKRAPKANIRSKISE